MAYGPPPGGGMMMPVSGGDPVLLTIGDIAITQNYVILPQGSYPLHGSVWTVQDSTVVSEGISTAGIVLTILTVWFLCLFGLLFLLMKEKKYSGFVTISVSGNGYYHQAQFPGGPQSSFWAADVVARARAITAGAPPMSA